MQLHQDLDIEKRFLYYFSKLYTSQLNQGQEFNELQKAIVIGILDYKLYNHSHYHSKMTVKEEYTNENYFRDFEIHLIEIPKYLKNVQNENTKLAKWLSFLTRKNMEVLDMAIKTNTMIKKAEAEYHYLIGDEAEQRKQELIDKGIRERKGEQSYAFNKGRINTLCIIVKNLLSKNYTLDEISQITNLTESEILDIKAKIEKDV